MTVVGIFVEQITEGTLVVSTFTYWGGLHGHFHRTNILDLN